MSPSALNSTVETTQIIIRLSSPLAELSTLTPLVDLLALTHAVTVPSPLKQSRLSTLLHTLSADPCPSSSSPSALHSEAEKLNSFIRFLSPVLNGMAGLREFEAAIDLRDDDPQDFRDFWTLEDRNLIKEYVEDGQVGGSSPGSEKVFLDAYVRDVSRRVALSQEGRLMLVDGHRKVGEQVPVAETKRASLLIYREQGLEG
ncbi:uncharacterized protein J7T54_001109 [Emericellopsis cladophorae]|uniref:Uncharacterized protein n=1 Tax=Emericellopsis cladophorae TaxID=2686198 RepID=A0A9Q0BDG3_9HYPO|nr:uncharacterized protein J7T54_001109 [Emericellopsis cladophorae]KAI6780801.1 hypothetical protein J7T54_001109 [Emericellopsis cladophorae]